MFSLEQSRIYYLSFNYWVVSLVVLVWVVSLIRILGSDTKINFNIIGFIIAIVFTSAIFLLIKPSFRIFSDEVILAQTSQSLIEQSQITIIDKRPLLFPFLVHLVHNTIGYSVNNAFLLNWILTVGMLWLLFSYGDNLGGTVSGIISVLLVLAHPAVLLSMSSGGFDLLNVVLLILSFSCLSLYIKKPSTKTATLLLSQLLLLSHARYESLIVLVIVVSYLLLKRQLRKHIIQSVIFPFVPFFLTPLLWQRLLVGNDPQPPPGTAMFSLSHSLAHTKEFFELLLMINSPFSSAVIIVGIVGIGWFLYQRHCVLEQRAVILTLIILWLLISSYFLASPADSFANRLYLPFCVGFSVVAAAFLTQKFYSRSKVFLLVLSFALFFIGIKQTYEKQFVANGLYASRYHSVIPFVLNIEEKPDLVIINNPNQLTIHNIKAVSFSEAVEHLSNSSNDVLVAQDINPNTGLATKATTLPGNVKLKTLFETAYHYQGQEKRSPYLRISMILGYIS